ncbi:hypothetical protein J3E69DRAFT_343385, partial [Trichoderma sp. SZMC 28015]
MISGEMWSVTVERGFFSRDIWPFLLLCPSAIFFASAYHFFFFCLFGLFGSLFLCFFSCCLLAFEDLFFRERRAGFALEMREDVGASP